MLVMTHYLYTLTYWEWLGFAVVLCGLEFLITTSGFLLWLALSAALVGVLLYLFPLLAWPYQLLIFSITGIICSVGWWTYLLRHRKSFHDEENDKK